VQVAVCGVTTRRQSQADEVCITTQAVDESCHDTEVEAAETSPVATRQRAKKPAAGFTRTLISKSEAGAHSLAKRTERLHLEKDEAPVVDDDNQVGPIVHKKACKTSWCRRGSVDKADSHDGGP
jgi:hypothetical protein